MRLILIKI